MKDEFVDFNVYNLGGKDFEIDHVIWERGG